MGNARECDVCGKVEKCNKFIAVELWEYDAGNLDDNKQLESIDVCKACLKEVKKVLKLNKRRFHMQIGVCLDSAPQNLNGKRR